MPKNSGSATHPARWTAINTAENATGSGSRRLFLAFRLPAAAAEELARWRDRMAAEFPPGSVVPVPLENLHITLLFLGNTGNERESGIRSGLRDVAERFPHLSFRTRGTLNLPRASDPRLLAVACSPDEKAITLSLVEQCSSLIADFGISVEKRPWKAHVTLLRFRAGNNGRADRTAAGDSLSSAGPSVRYAGNRREPVQAQIPELEGLRFTVDSLDLMLSSLTVQGARYSVVEEFLLRGGQSRMPG